MKIEIYSQNGKKLTKKVDLNKSVFGIKPSQHSVYLVIKEEQLSKRQGTSKAKNKAEVSGSGSKPWKQKGTGRARIGLIRNSARVGGGAAFGPSPRAYSIKVNKKVKILARKSILSDKAASESLMVLDKISMDSCKTKDFCKIIKNLGLESKKVTFLINEKNENLYRSSKNIHNVKVSCTSNVSSFDLINNDKLVMDEGSLTYFNQL